MVRARKSTTPRTLRGKAAPTPEIEITLPEARRLAVAAQRLAGVPVTPTLDGLRDVARDIRVLQIDPTNVVARTQLLVMRSRVGTYDAKLMDELVWDERFFFHYFAHQASLVLTEDFPIFRYHMRHALDPATGWGKRVLDWIEINRALRDHILARLRREGGPLRVRDFEDRSVEPWESSGWTATRNVSRMLDFLWLIGKVTIAGRIGQERLWDLTERWLPPWTPREPLPRREVVERSIEVSLRCLGAAIPRHIKAHFTRAMYPGFEEALRSLVRRGIVQPVTVRGFDTKAASPWYLHRDRLSLLDQVRKEWRPRTTLLSPFDNLICDRDRTEALFGFHFRIEIYVPKAQRKFGYFVLPILYGERLIGRVDAAVDRRREVLMVKEVHAEPDAPTAAAADDVARALHELADFVSDGRVEVHGSTIPSTWRAALA